MLKIFKRSKLIKGISLGLLMLTCISSSMYPVHAQESVDLKVVDLGHGEYRVVSDDSSARVPENQLNSSNGNSIGLKKIRNNIFQLEGSDEKLLKVSDSAFLRVGELTINVTDEKDMNLLRNSLVGQAVKDHLEELSKDCINNPQNDPIINLYSPNLIENEKSASGGASTNATGSYYTGKGGYTYKQEFFTMGIRYTEAYNATYTKGEDALAAVKKTAEFAIDTGIGKTAWGTPYSVIKFISSLLLPIFTDQNVKMLNGTNRVIQGKEMNGEVRFCYIRMDMGHGLDDYCKARSSTSSFQWLERLCVPDKDEENYVINQPLYKGEGFDALDTKAYDWRTSLSYFDSVRYSITHKAANKSFDLFPRTI